MQTRVAKWGHSLAVRIPRAFAEQIGIAEGSTVDIAVSDDAIVLRKPNYILDDLLAGVTPDNLHGETESGPAIGREAW